MDTEGVLLRFDGLFRRVQEEGEADKETVEAVDSFLVVAAFIAGVQAQIISLTLNIPRSVLSRAANFFAFVGLMLEISGTFLGAIHSVFLRRKIKSSTRTINIMIQCKEDLKIVLKHYEGEEQKRSTEKGEKAGVREDPHPQSNQPWSMFEGAQNVTIMGGTFGSFMVQKETTTEDIEDQQERLERIHNTLREIKRFRDGQAKVIGAIEKVVEIAEKQINRGQARDPPPPGILAHAPTQLDLDAQGRVEAVEIVGPIFKFGNIPMVSMASGVVCLAISTIFLSVAAKDQGPELWISSTLVLVVVMILSFFPFSSWVLEKINYHWTHVAGSRRPMPRQRAPAVQSV